MSAVIALRNPEVQITVVDISGTRIDAWNSEKMPIIDPRLDSIVKRVRGCNLAFTLDVDKAVYEADMIFICVGILTKKNRTEKDMALDMSSVDVATIDDLLNPDRILIGSLETPSGYGAVVALRLPTRLGSRIIKSFAQIFWSSELSKLATNALLAQRISSMNAISAICEATGASVSELS
ncbi:MAG: hypothetical protein Q9175_004983 [Cornicularia normoerica]